MEDAYLVQGGSKLTGSIVLSGAKNVALKAIVAALLMDSKIVLNNVPRINDVTELLHLVGKLGASIKFASKNTLEIDPSNLTLHRVDLLHASKIRVSFLLFAPLLHKFGECYIPNPGGCRIGERPIDRIIEGIKHLGAEISYDSETGYYHGRMNEKPHGKYKFSKPSHTGTELLIMFSVLGSEKIVMENVALEPEIDHLIEFLNKAGARIKRNGKKIEIIGVKSLKQTEPYTIPSDRNEAVTFAVAGIASKGDVFITNIEQKYIEEFIRKLKQTGSRIEIQKGEGIRFRYSGKLKSVDIETSPHPGFMTDWQPNWAVLMTQAKGESIIHERIFENRFSYVSELMKLGAHIDYVSRHIWNPDKTYFFNYDKKKTYQQMIRIHGGHPLHGGVLHINDLRAGASLLIASLIAQGESIVQGSSILERGYENITEKVLMLNGQMKKL